MNDKQGRVTIYFVVEKDGSVGRMYVASSPHLTLSNEVMRVMRRSPKWTPGMVDGEPVCVRFTLPVEFRFQ